MHHTPPPPPVEPQPKVARHNLSITLDEPSNLTCSVDALPLPSFSWALFRDGYDQPLSDESWSVVQRNGSASSVLTRSFEMSDFAEDCTLVLVCNAENDYGSSRQYFILSLNECAPVVFPPPSPPPTLSASNQDSAGSIEEDESRQGEEGGGSMFTTLVAVFGAGMLVIVVGVSLVLAYFIKHFYNKHRYLYIPMHCTRMPVYVSLSTLYKHFSVF